MVLNHDQKINDIDYTFNVCNLYYGIKIDGKFEYGIRNENDFVIADRCGTVFVAADKIHEVLDLAERIAKRQDGMVQAVRSGRSVQDIMHDKEFEAINVGDKK